MYSAQGGCYTMKKLTITLTLIISISLVGCNHIKKPSGTFKVTPTPTSESHVIEQLTDTNLEYESNDYDTDDTDTRFSYLDQLSPDKQVAFMKFIAEEHNLQYLYNFSPEEMVLVYLHSISQGYTESIYAITYHNGLLPDNDTFRNEYYEYASKHDSETAVHYRYFDTIEIDENTAEENKVAVIVTAGVGIMTHSIILGLQKEDKVWKMDIYHMIEHYKELANEVSE